MTPLPHCLYPKSQKNETIKPELGSVLFLPVVIELSQSPTEQFSKRIVLNAIGSCVTISRCLRNDLVQRAGIVRLICISIELYCVQYISNSLFYSKLIDE